jgi:hypothetical protein
LGPVRTARLRNWADGCSRPCSGMAARHPEFADGGRIPA